MSIVLAALIGLLFGVGIGASLQRLGGAAKRLSAHKPVIHMRGHRPAWYSKSYCENRNCDPVLEEGKGWHRKNACYIDQDGHYWCERHLPANTRVAERAAIDETEDDRCVTHDYVCPKPWEPY